MRNSKNPLLANHPGIAFPRALPCCKAALPRNNNLKTNSMRLGCWVAFCSSTMFAQLANGQAPSSNRHYDPATGITYERQIRTVDQPTVETVMESKVVTVSRPEVVTETEPVTRNYLTPVVQYEWQPRWRGLWNPFTPATLEYQYVPQTRWETISETYSRLKSSVRWTTEQRVVKEPRLVTSIKKQQVEEWVAVGQSLPNSSTRVASLPTGTPANANSTLRPMSTLPSGTSASGIRPGLPGGMRPTVLDPYSTRTYSSGSIFR
jgi:hypothetical protein